MIADIIVYICLSYFAFVSRLHVYIPVYILGLLVLFFFSRYWIFSRKYFGLTRDFGQL